jgi:hypothetical protein
VKLTDKQSAKVSDLLKSVFETDDCAEAIKAAEVAPTAAAIKKARKLLAKELFKLDKALLIYGLDIAFDEAKALIEKKG